jgi:hypothetical protein
MKIQKDPSNNELLNLDAGDPRLPASLGGRRGRSTTRRTTRDTLANKSMMKPNIGGKMFEDIIDTARLSRHAPLPVRRSGHRAGARGRVRRRPAQPFMDMQQGWRVDGVEWKVRLDYGVGAIDFRGAVTNAG